MKIPLSPVPATTASSAATRQTLSPPGPKRTADQRRNGNRTTTGARSSAGSPNTYSSTALFGNPSGSVPGLEFLLALPERAGLPAAPTRSPDRARTPTDFRTEPYSLGRARRRAGPPRDSGAEPRRGDSA